MSDGWTAHVQLSNSWTVYVQLSDDFTAYVQLSNDWTVDVQLSVGWTVNIQLSNCWTVYVQLLNFCPNDLLHCVNYLNINYMLKLMSQNAAKFYALSQQVNILKIRAFRRTILV